MFRGRTVDYSKPLAKVIAVRDAELARSGIEAAIVGIRSARRGLSMHDAMSRAERYRIEAAGFSASAKNASSDFVRGNYQRIAEWYLTLAEGEFKQPEKPKEVSVTIEPEHAPEVKGRDNGTWYSTWLKWWDRTGRYIETLGNATGHGTPRSGRSAASEPIDQNWLQLLIRNLQIDRWPLRSATVLVGYLAVALLVLTGIWLTERKMPEDLGAGPIGQRPEAPARSSADAGAEPISDRRPAAQPPGAAAPASADPATPAPTLVPAAAVPRPAPQAPPAAPPREPAAPLVLTPQSQSSTAAVDAARSPEPASADPATPAPTLVPAAAVPRPTPQAPPAAAPSQPAAPLVLKPQSQSSAAAVDTARSPAPAGATPRAIEGGGWVVQLLAQKTEVEVKAAFGAMQTKYSMLGSYQPLIRKKDQGEHGVFYAALVGPLTREEANQLCIKLKSAGGSCFIQRN